MAFDIKRLVTSIVTFGVSLLLVGIFAISASAQTAESIALGPDAECPSAEVVESLGPATNDRRQAFDITGQSFRVTYQVNFTVSENRFRDFSVDIVDEFGLVESDSTDQSGTRSFTVPEGPGSFEVVTDVEPENGAGYTLVIEDCTGVGNGSGNGDGNGGGGNGSANDQYSPNVEVTNIINIPDKNLPPTGGPPLLAIFFSVVAGVGLITAVVRRRY